MTAKEYLQQLERLNLLIQQKMKEQHDLEEMSKCVRAIDYSKDRVSSSCSGDAPFVNPVLKIVQLEQEINAEIDKYVDMKHTIINQIQQLPNTQHVKILYERYVQEHTFEQIAVNMNSSIRSVYNLHGQALQVFQKKFLQNDELL